jgi:hypothetical protein
MYYISFYHSTRLYISNISTIPTVGCNVILTDDQYTAARHGVSDLEVGVLYDKTGINIDVKLISGSNADTDIDADIDTDIDVDIDADIDIDNLYDLDYLISQYFNNQI